MQFALNNKTAILETFKDQGVYTVFIKFDTEIDKKDVSKKRVVVGKIIGLNDWSTSHPYDPMRTISIVTNRNNTGIMTTVNVLRNLVIDAVEPYSFTEYSKIEGQLMLNVLSNTIKLNLTLSKDIVSIV